MKNITIVGIGYVGLSIAILLSKKNNVIALDIDKKKVDAINRKISPIKDKEIQNYLEKEKLNLKATKNKRDAYKNSDFIIVATNTNYDKSTGAFDTSTVEKVIKEIIRLNKSATIVIKSTIPIGFTEKIKSFFKIDNIFFSPEFLRESKALYDNLYPSRIIVGDVTKKAKKFGQLLLNSSKKKKHKSVLLFMSSTEAESVKLFSNTYLAMRIAFFNELDSFSEFNNLSSKDIINGVCADNRIGNYYNNPSFGYGGYCLPKDTRQLLFNYKNIPNKIIKATIESNKIRKKFVLNSILKKSPRIVGIYRLLMKVDSDNFRESAILDIILQLQKNNIKILLFEPLIKNFKLKGVKQVENISMFKSKVDLIIANRLSVELDDVISKVYSRDIFNEN